MSVRVQKTENPHLEDVCERYEDVPNLTMLCVGSVHWNPPEKALQALAAKLTTPQVSKYGSIMGDEKLCTHLKQHLSNKGLDMTDMNITVTAGANQGFNNLALTVCDAGDKAVLVAPFFFSHKLSLQMNDVEVSVCPFNTKTLAPNFDALEEMVTRLKPKMVVLTTPNNPSGYVYTRAEVARVVSICKGADAWLVADQTYHEFLHDDAVHVFPCGKHADFSYEKIIHVFSFSKIFGMPGWRVGFLAYPKVLYPSMRKVQDTIPTHAARLSQSLALECMELYYPLQSPEELASTKSVESDPPNSPVPAFAKESYSEWAKTTVGSLECIRAAFWPVVQPLGTIYTKGAFYYLIPVPPQVTEEEAVDILARQYGVLLMYGTPFGAPGNLRVSYGNLAPEEVPAALDKIKRGFQRLLELSAERTKSTQEGK